MSEDPAGADVVAGPPSAAASLSRSSGGVIEARSTSYMRSGLRVVGCRLLVAGCVANDRENLVAEFFRLAGADPVDVPQCVARRRLDARKLAERRVMKDDVRRHTAIARELQTH